jgi:hypothetical protein
MTVAQHSENELLLSCVCTRLSPDQLLRLNTLVQKDLDWNYFYSLARRHSLVPLVFSQLEKLAEHVPNEILARFRKDYLDNAARNLVLADELVQLIRALSEIGTEAITFKGPALAIAAYGDLSARRFVDLDLIVQRADVRRAIETLTARGYVATTTLDPQQQSALIQQQHNLQFSRSQVIVELHWQVASELFASSVTAEDLWQNLDSVSIGKSEVKTLSPEDLLFALSVHGSRHLWQRLAWICDIDRLINTQHQLDWSRLIERAGKAKARRMFLLAPALAANLLGTPLPNSVELAIKRDPRIAKLVEEVRAQLFDSNGEPETGVAATFRYNMLVRSDWRSRIRYFRYGLSLTDADFEAAHFSPRFHFIYYLLRPLRVLRASRSRGTAT